MGPRQPGGGSAGLGVQQADHFLCATDYSWGFSSWRRETPVHVIEMLTGPTRHAAVREALRHGIGAAGWRWILMAGKPAPRAQVHLKRVRSVKLPRQRAKNTWRRSHKQNDHFIQVSTCNGRNRIKTLRVGNWRQFIVYTYNSCRNVARNPEAHTWIQQLYLRCSIVLGWTQVKLAIFSPLFCKFFVVRNAWKRSYVRIKLTKKSGPQRSAHWDTYRAGNFNIPDVRVIPISDFCFWAVGGLLTFSGVKCAI